MSSHKYTQDKAMRKSLRLSRRQQRAEDTKTVIATGISLAITFAMTVIMISQLASCTIPPKLDAYEQHNADVRKWSEVGCPRTSTRAELNDMWGTLYIEAQLINMGYN